MVNLTSRIRLSFVLCTCLLASIAACSSDNSSSSSSSGGSSSSSGSSSGGSSSSSGGQAGACTGDITGCTVGSLSSKQNEDMCSLITTTIDDPPGTKYECKTGPKSGLFLTVNSKDQCIQSKPPATCKVKVSELIACYKAAKKDACAAFDDQGACGPLFSPSSGCS